mmetsp:Transcript_112833/g.319099  ORF Transcript_112833/g.319099 Transcript_112833/m.319099 type:complete len:200 (-) Transcript_112833:1115-1714(-)
MQSSCKPLEELGSSMRLARARRPLNQGQLSYQRRSQRIELGPIQLVFRVIASCRQQSLQRLPLLDVRPRHIRRHRSGLLQIFCDRTVIHPDTACTAVFVSQACRCNDVPQLALLLQVQGPSSYGAQSFQLSSVRRPMLDFVKAPRAQPCTANIGQLVFLFGLHLEDASAPMDPECTNRRYAIGERIGAGEHYRVPSTNL